MAGIPPTTSEGEESRAEHLLPPLSPPIHFKAVMPFVLSEALPVIPAKFVRRILKPEFVDMSQTTLRRRGGGGRQRAMVTSQVGSVAGRYQTYSAGCRALPAIQRWSSRGTLRRRGSSWRIKPS